MSELLTGVQKRSELGLPSSGLHPPKNKSNICHSQSKRLKRVGQGAVTPPQPQQKRGLNQSVNGYRGLNCRLRWPNPRRNLSIKKPGNYGKLGNEIRGATNLFVSFPTQVNSLFWEVFVHL